MIRLSPSAQAILQHMGEGDTIVYGYSVIKDLGISNAATYKALYALERLGLVEGWLGGIGDRSGKHRRYYELTDAGRSRAIR